MNTAVLGSWGIAALATGGVILRPFRIPEWIWAVAGAALLVFAGLLPPAAAWHGIRRGTDVYLFLTGMMLLAELARCEGLFDWLAVHAARASYGQGGRLFTLTYAVGTLVTVFLSNDATAVVLTPAVAAAARAARMEAPAPLLLACAFVANAASFVLPISNPANLVVYGDHVPPLGAWLARFGVASALATLSTYAVLRLVHRRTLRQSVCSDLETPSLGIGARLAAAGIAAAAVALTVASALDAPLGLPTCAAGAATLAAVGIVRPARVLPVLRGVSWGVLPLVAGLFVLVEAMAHTGVVAALAGLLRAAAAQDAHLAGWAAGAIAAIACNLMNNLPAGLLAGSAVQAAHAPPALGGAVLIGIDLGPNLSVTGSLATILWLTALRREGIEIRATHFLALGALVMPVSLALALAAILLPHATP